MKKLIKYLDDIIDFKYILTYKFEKKINTADK